MKFLKALSLVAMSLLLVQCYPNGPEYVDELDLVYSNYYSSYDFSSKKTYAIPDQILKVDEDLLEGTDKNYINPIYAVPILNTIDSNMKNYGWTKVALDANPDLVLAPVGIEVTDYYYNYYYYGYGGYYGWYYPYPTVSSYSTGTLLVTMFDPKLMTPNDKATATWTFAVNGLLEGSNTEFTNRMIKGVDQAFKQSTYLKK